jgi:hypothetical protein
MLGHDALTAIHYYFVPGGASTRVVHKTHVRRKDIMIVRRTGSYRARGSAK